MRPKQSHYGGIIEPLADAESCNLNGAAAPEAHPPRGRSCLAFSAAEDAAFAFIERDMRSHLCGMCLQEGQDFVIETDAVGNLFITYFGIERENTVLYHSHVDSVPDGGPLDGVWGVNIARDLLLKLAHFRSETGAMTRRSLTMAVWRAEESSMTGRACVGSAIATGELTPEKLENMSYGKNGTEQTLREYWRRYQEQERSWEGVLQEAAHPIIQDDGSGTLTLTLPSGTRRIALAEEGHIAQAKLLQETGSDVHIVQGGIGGSIREDFVIPADKITVDTVRVGQGEFVRMIVEVIGEEAHTGGTVHNRDETRTEGGPWFRRDALVGMYIVSKVLFGKGEKNRGVHVLGVEPDALTGYTKVPRLQRMHLLVRAADAHDFARDALHECQTTLRTTRDLHVSWRDEAVPAGQYHVLGKRQMVGLLSIPARMEGAPRKTDAHVDNAPRVIWHVTSTATDLVLSPQHGCSMKLDFRFTDIVHIERLRAHFMQEVQERVCNRVLSGEELDAFRTERSRAACGKVSAMIANQKSRIAACLGYSVLKAPVLPGHDSNTLAKAIRHPSFEGTQVSMTIAEDNGLSHNPLEAARITALRKAQLVSQSSVIEALSLEGIGMQERFIGCMCLHAEHVAPQVDA